MKTEKKPSTEKILISQFPEIANDLNTFWQRYSRHMGLNGGWAHFTLPNEVTPRDMARDWARQIDELTSECNIENINEKNLQTTIVLLRSLAEELNFYMGPFWREQSREERFKLKVMMDFHAQTLLETFKNRGYISEPFELK